MWEGGGQPRLLESNVGGGRTAKASLYSVHLFSLAFSDCCLVVRPDTSTELSQLAYEYLCTINKFEVLGI